MPKRRPDAERSRASAFHAFLREFLPELRDWLDTGQAVDQTIALDRIERVSKRLRFAILKRDGFACLYCGRRPPEAELEVDHVRPRSRGGSDDPSNLVTACRECNRGKAAFLLDPKE